MIHPSDNALVASSLVLIVGALVPACRFAAWHGVADAAIATLLAAGSIACMFAFARRAWGRFTASL